FDPALNVAAVIVNRVGGDTHARWVSEAIRAACRAVPVGAIPRDDAWWAMPERHLGLLTAADGVLAGERLVRMAETVERAVDGEPPDVDGLYFGGGYPELDAQQLADNARCRKSVRRFALDPGRPVYAECGGLMYLAESLEDADGRVHEMVGLLPARVTMRPPR